MATLAPADPRAAPVSRVFQKSARELWIDSELPKKPDFLYGTFVQKKASTLMSGQASTTCADGCRTWCDGGRGARCRKHPGAGCACCRGGVARAGWPELTAAVGRRPS